MNAEQLTKWIQHLMNIPVPYIYTEPLIREMKEALEKANGNV